MSAKNALGMGMIMVARIGQQKLGLRREGGKPPITCLVRVCPARPQAKPTKMTRDDDLRL